MHEPKPLTTTRETLDLWPDTARLLGIGRNAVYDAAHRGDFRTIRMGKRILVPKSEIRRLLGDKTVAGAFHQTVLDSEWETK
jgi:excisionase family DNA binding protein